MKEILDNSQIIDDAKLLEGHTIRALVRLNSIFFPKKVYTDITPGEFGIIKLDLISLDDNCSIPLDFATLLSWRNHADNYSFVAKGPIPLIEPGQVYFFEGALMRDKKFGYQYSILQFHKVYELTSEADKKIFLRSVFGDTRTEMLYNAFADPYEILKSQDRETLCMAKGIGEATADMLISKFNDNVSNEGDIVQLQEYGLSSKIIFKMQAVYHSTDTILHLIKTNPYAFVDTIEGIGWAKADQIALSCGYPPCGEERIKAFTVYYLKEQANAIGHSWILLDDLVDAIRNIAFGITDEQLRIYLRKWTTIGTKGNLGGWLYYQADTGKIGLTYYRKLEEEIAKEILRIKQGNIHYYTEEEVENAIAQSEAANGFPYTEEQHRGIVTCINNGVSILSGAAGTGKTFSMKPIVHLLANHELYAQCSLSGKAASNLSEVTGQGGYTIHRLLEYDGIANAFAYNKNNPMPYDTIILDELSLVGGEIFLSLLQAVKTGCRLIMLGDPNQLEAIGLANLLKDFVDSGQIPTTCLLQIHRQAAHSGIITESLKVSSGQQIVSLMPEISIRGELCDLKVVSYNDNDLSQEKVLEEFMELYNKRGIPIKDISIVVPMRSRGNISCATLNSMIQNIVNGVPKPNDIQLTNDDKVPYILREGDKVIIVKNNYQIKNKEGKSAPIFNGNTGYIVAIEEKNMTVNLTQQGEVIIPRAEWGAVELGYAITCHKCQGSSSPYVIVALDMSAYSLLSKEWVYTALTRAKKFCVFVTQINAARKATLISRVILKQTWMQEILRNPSILTNTQVDNLFLFLPEYNQS